VSGSYDHMSHALLSQRNRVTPQQAIVSVQHVWPNRRNRNELYKFKFLQTVSEFLEFQTQLQLNKRRRTSRPVFSNNVVRRQIKATLSRHANLSATVGLFC